MKSCLTLKNRKKILLPLSLYITAPYVFILISRYLCVRVCVCFFKSTEVSPSTEGRVFVSFMLVAGSSAVEHWL